MALLKANELGKYDWSKPANKLLFNTYVGYIVDSVTLVTEAKEWSRDNVTLRKKSVVSISKDEVFH